MPSILHTSLAAAGFSILTAGAPQAQQTLPIIPVPTVEADDFGFRIFRVMDFLQKQNDRSVPVAYEDGVQLAQAAPKSLADVDFIFQDTASGIICESKLVPIMNAGKPYPMTKCGVSRDPLRQFQGGEESSAQEYFDDIAYVTELQAYDSNDNSMSVVENIIATKGEFTFSLQRAWEFTHSGDVHTCLSGHMKMEGVNEPITTIDEICNEDPPVTNYMGDIFIEYEQELAPFMFPDMFNGGPSSF